MTPTTRSGPSGIMLYPVEIDVQDLKFREGDAFTAICQDLATVPSVSYFVDEHLDILEAPRLCVLLDEPSRTTTRAALVIAVAAELSRRHRRVIIIDGDDQLPDLSHWAGLGDKEGWIDMIRHGMSLSATSRTIFPDDERVRLMGVGSYSPTRVTAQELTRLLTRLEHHADIVLVSVSSGDRGAVWSGLPSLRILCWDPEVQSSQNIESQVRDAALLGSYPTAILTFAGEHHEPEAPQSWTEALGETTPVTDVRRSSPLFRNLALVMSVLVVLIAAWWLLQPLLNGTGGGTSPSDDAAVIIADAGDDIAVTDPATTDPASAQQTTSHDGEEPAGGSLAADQDRPVGQDATPPADVPEATAAQQDNVTIGDAATDDEAIDDAAIDDAATDDAATDDAATGIVVEDVDDFDPFQVEVAAAGWCLHIFSYRDQERLDRGLRMMSERGFRYHVKRTSDEKGLLLRVYTGSFPNRSEANAALPEALRRLDANWGQPQPAARIR